MTNLKKVVTSLIASVVAFSLPGLAYATITVGSSSITTDSTLNLQGGNIGIGTSLAGKALEINSATGANLRLTYNDSDGAAASYGDLSVTSGGDLTLAPSGGDLNITGNGAVSGTLGVTGNSTFTGTLGVAGGPAATNKGINIVNTGAYGGGGIYQYGILTSLTATDNSSVYGGSFSASSSTSGGLPDHPILIGVAGGVYYSGSGRIDVAEGSGGNIQNYGTGTINEAYGSFTQVLNIGSAFTNFSHGVYSDTVNTSSVNAITTASAFYGKIRTLSGTSGYGTAMGLNLSGWSTPGASVTTSYGIYMDTSIDIGTTKYALYSSSTSDSYLQGDVGIGTNDPTEKLDINSNNIRIRTAKTPATAAEACNQGEIAWDSSYMYICIADNSWHRSAHATW